jgi:hypothetical protein
MRGLIRLLFTALLVCGLLVLGGCASSGTTSTTVYTSYYGGYGWNDPYYNRRCCYGRPPGYRPPVHRPPVPSQPIYRPPMPSQPRPTPRMR